jgi:glucose-6-phosphate 1-dehydrogenase
MHPPQVVIFGASGDLTLRKLVPALTSLAGKDRPTGGFYVVGVARSEKSDDAFRDELAAALPEALRAAFATLAPRVCYVQGDVQRPDDLARLKQRLAELPGGAEAGRLFYLSLKPDLFARAAGALKDAGLLDPAGPREPFRRVVIEKPFGHDLASGRALNHALARGDAGGPDLPHRPLPRQGDRAKPARFPLP